MPYKLTENITLVDNRGYKSLDPYETGEIFAQLGNLLPLGDTVTWSRGFDLSQRIVKAEKEIKTSDFIVPVFVHSVRRSIAPQERDELQCVIRTAMELTGVYPIVVLTHKTSGNLTGTEMTFRNMGVDRIFAFENYTENDTRKLRGRHEEVLKFLCEVIKDVQFRAAQPRDPVREMKDRKKFVLNFVQAREAEIQRLNIEEQKKREREERERKLTAEQEALEKRARKEEKMHKEEIRKQREENRRMKEIQDAEFRREEEDAQTHHKKRKKRCVLQ
ncbi:uncharacterized protein LOC134943904 isoform X2 [Pseudophryne corroboree]